MINRTHKIISFRSSNSRSWKPQKLHAILYDIHIFTYTPSRPEDLRGEKIYPRTKDTLQTSSKRIDWPVLPCYCYFSSFSRTSFSYQRATHTNCHAICDATLASDMLEPLKLMHVVSRAPTTKPKKNSYVSYIIYCIICKYFYVVLWRSNQMHPNAPSKN